MPRCGCCRGPPEDESLEGLFPSAAAVDGMVGQASVITTRNSTARGSMGVVASAQSAQAEVQVQHDLQFPMYLMSFETVMGLEAMKTHQELLITEQLVEWSSDMQGRVVFISHEWLGYEHPDPANEQLHALQGILGRLAAGKHKVETEWLAQLVTQENQSVHPSRWARALPNCYFWLDFAGVPQVSLTAATPGLAATASADGRLDVSAHEKMLQAVQSIPAYVERSTLVLVLAPVTRHSRDPARICDYASWGARGWCRVELYAALLSPSSTRIMVCKGGGHTPEFVGALDCLQHLPGQGNFTCCALGHEIGGRTIPCDKPQIRMVLKRVLDGAVRHFGRTEKWELMRFLICAEDYLFTGLPDTDSRMKAPRIACNGRDCQQPEQCFDAFKRRCRWRHGLDDERAARRQGWSLLHWAVVAGELCVLNTLLQAGPAQADVEARTPVKLLELGFPGLAPPLHLAVMAGSRSAETLALLLDARANPHSVSKPHGGRILGAICIYASVKEIQFWLKRFPQWNLEERDAIYCVTPLSAAALRPNPLPYVAALMEARADVRASSACMAKIDCPLLNVCSTDNGDEAMVQMLLDAKSDPNSRMRPTSRAWRLLMDCCRATTAVQHARGKQPGKMALCMAMRQNATALHLAAWQGGPRVVQALLEGRADPWARNLAGYTPLQLAELQFGGQVPETLLELLPVEV